MRRLRTTLAAIGCLAVLGLAAPSAQAANTPACTAADLGAKAGVTGAGMSQPFATVILTNRSGHACSLTGYPKVVSMATGKGAKPITVKNGRLGNITGGKPKRIVLAPGAHAWFAVGAATAYDPPLVTFRAVAYTIGGKVKTTTIALEATAPKGKPFPIGVTAYTAGRPPRNS